MKMKWLLAFALAGLSIASAKTYHVTISDPSVVAGVQLKPGNYKLNLEGSKVLFIGNREKLAAEANATKETSPKKFEYTSVDFKVTGGKYRIESISLGGTRTKLDFN